jgi:KipI family sensor histidine kinase inhibitor
MGDAALLVELDDLSAVLALERRLAPLLDGGEGIWASIEDAVPAARTVLLVTRPGTDLAAVRDAVTAASRSLDPERRTVDEDKPALEIRVRYDGPDLAEVAHLTGLTPAEVVAAHTGRPWQVAFCGFSPGFAYLVDGDPRLVVPRRADPRARVPAGAVGLAGEFSGVYPRESPGGWQLIGTTDAVLWDADREPPALLAPGAAVRFVDAEGP